MTKTVIVTGGAGFIGSAVIRQIIRGSDWNVVNFDKLTYAGSLTTVADVCTDERYSFEHEDICDASAVANCIARHQPDMIMHLAAETHVDRSIDGPAEFVKTNITGTYTLLEAARHYFESRKSEAGFSFLFHHISTDEVFGSLGESGFFSEQTPYRPNSPYAASKAASDHLVRAWFKTYQLPTVVSNCSNNYGPYQFPEKLIPLVISKALGGEDVPIYGDGSNVRDWLFVEDHAAALLNIAANGVAGETYNVGGNSESSNLDLVTQILKSLDHRSAKPDSTSYLEQIRFVKDRPGHDQRYAIDASHIQQTLGWQPEFSLAQGLSRTIDWYMSNPNWLTSVSADGYAGQRLGLGESAT